ncbi:MAG: DinB family protein [Balneolaceae bacterium]
MKHSAIQQYEYHKWANNRIFERLNELPDDVYEQQIKSVFSSLQEVMVHIYQTDGMWLSVMSGDDFPKTMDIINQQKEKSTGQDLEGMQELYGEISVEYNTFLKNHHDLDELMTIEHPNYGKLETSVAQQVKHVVNHGTYHRGNIAAMLRQQGHPGVPTDYIFFLYAQT